MQVLEGNIFDSLQPTDKYLKIVAYLPPVAPPNIFALGFSYRKHADEIGTNASPYPVVFIKANTSLTGHETEILLPAAGPDQVDYEGDSGPHCLRIRTMINDQVVQDASTASMIYDIATIVSDLSQSLTLLPGTVILTGTPEGVGFTRQPPPLPPGRRSCDSYNRRYRNPG